MSSKKVLPIYRKSESATDLMTKSKNLVTTQMRFTRKNNKKDQFEIK